MTNLVSITSAPIANFNDTVNGDIPTVPLPSGSYIDTSLTLTSPPQI